MVINDLFNSIMKLILFIKHNYFTKKNRSIALISILGVTLSSCDKGVYVPMWIIILVIICICCSSR